MYGLEFRVYRTYGIQLHFLGGGSGRRDLEICTLHKADSCTVKVGQA